MLNRKPTRSLGYILPLSVGALALYLYTALPGPGWVDSGELAMVSQTLGVPHPTGSPLYVVLSRVVSLLHPGEFWPLVFLSSLAVAAALAFVLLSLPTVSTAAGRGAFVVAGLMLALAPTLWEQATVNEVYALQALLFALFLYVRTLGAGVRREAGSAYLAGLAFANHQSAIFLAPFLVTDVWSGRRRLRTWISVFGFGLVGVSLYLYLPIRSSAGPLWDWGGTHQLSAFLRHITGWQYKNWVGLNSLAELWKALGFAGRHLARNLAFVGIPLAALGLREAWIRSRAGTVASAIAFLLCLTFGMNFPNPDLESFYLLLYVLGAYWAGLGLCSLTRLRPAWGLVSAAVLAGAVGYQAVEGFAGLNSRSFRVPTQWVEDALETVEPGAVVLTREWDHYSPWLYLRWVKRVRPDVTWIDTELLRRSWYPDFIRRADSTRYRAALPALERLAPQIQKFESGALYDPAEIEGAYADAIYALSLGQQGAVYVDGVAATPRNWGVERRYLRGADEVPWGLLVRLFRPDETIPPLPDWPTYHNSASSPDDSQRTRFNLELYRRMREAREQFLSAG